MTSPSVDGHLLPDAAVRNLPAFAMLLEDDPAAAEQLIEALRACNPAMRIALTGTLGEFLAYDGHAEIDAYLIDLGLPDGDGVSAFEFLRARNSGALALAASSQSDQVSVTRALAAGACGYLFKYDARRDIERALEIAFDGGATVTPTIAARLIAYARADESNAKRIPSAADAPSTADGRAACVTSDGKFRLTVREHEILTLASRGYTFPQVAELMGARVSTVYSHVRNIYGKMSVSNISNALFEARQRGIL